ncbi:MAG: outer membrane beta-barrel protein [Campylobacterota bacterium]|nr:outer membrane beta-barrel protein [Campylobacterota bacterium]
MKKTLSILLLFTSLYSDAKIYFGANYGQVDEKFKDNLDAKNSSQAITFKFGYGDIDAYSVDLSLDIIENQSNMFSQSDAKKYALNVELIKAFNFDIFINPFFKAGFGSGTMKIDRTLQDRINYGSLNLGTGVFIPINNYFDLEIGYKYSYRSYEEVDTIVEKESYKSDVNAVYSGFNIRY